jgi:hypothetical protein
MMGAKSVPRRVLPIWLALILSALLILAGTHLLESLCFLMGITEPRVVGSETHAGVEQTVDPVLFMYRVLISLAILVLAYAAGFRKEKTRRALCLVLSLDLTVWLLHTMYSLLQSDPVRLTSERLAVQLGAVAIEAVALWFLMHPSFKKDFVSHPNGSNIQAL